MTLAQWQDKCKVTAQLHKSGAYWIPEAKIRPIDRFELWRLSDYVVSSVIGGSIWLVKREGARNDTSRNGSS